MTDTKDKKTLTLKPKLQLSKPVDSGGRVRQSFSQGRSKTVTVEVKKTRSFTRDESGKIVDSSSQKAKLETEEQSQKASVAEESSADLSGLTESERKSRMRALKLAAEQQEKEEQAAREAKEQEEKEKEERKRLGIEAPKQEEVEKPVAAKASEKEEVLPEAILPDATKSATKKESPKKKELSRGKLDDDSSRDTKGKKTEKVLSGKFRRDDDRRTGRLSVNSAFDQEEQRGRSLASIRRAREKKARRREASEHLQMAKEKISREITLPEFITVQELANRMAERGVDVIKELMKLGTLVTINQVIDADTAELVASEMGHKIKRVTEADVENILIEDDDDPATLKDRVPVVTVMGHVDHGKTSLLDALRSTNVIAKEAGGITQHIGAYQVELDDGKKVTFLDTPGHEAFTAMRSRGAKVTDVVILVVAADDGVMPQTIEAINHAKAAGVPIIVAVNKMDKPDADPTRVVNALLEHELVSEDLGGDVMTVPISAKEGTNLEKLLESVLLQAEMLELKANPDRAAVGVVVESKVDKGRGVVATLLVQRGTLRVGDIVVAGMACGSVRALLDDKAEQIDEAGPSVPVEILGLDEPPEAGEQFSVVETDRQAREIVEYRKKLALDKRVVAGAQGTLEQMFSRAANTGPKELAVIVKSDVQGSSEAISASLAKIGTNEVNVRVIHAAVGGITESDVSLAKASGAVIIGFNVRAGAHAKELASKEGIELRYYSIIYNLIDDMKALLGGMLEPTLRETYLGTAEIRQIFKVTKSGKVAGSFVTDGVIKRGAGVRLLRDDVVIHEGKLKTLKRFKDDVKEVKEGYECGIAFENYDDIKEGDKVEAFEVVEEKREII